MTRAVDAAPPRCAALSLERHDPRDGTAAPVRRWLLIEQPGPWGRDALLSSRLDGEVAVALQRRCAAAGVRPMLIRRPGRAQPATGQRWAIVDSRPGHEASWWGVVQGAEDLLDVSLSGSSGEFSSAPAYLVCTHARHDACCAIRGRPVAAALAAARPEQVWECSHVGGDRFAANVVVLPHGLYYGTVTTDDVPRLLATHDGGRLALDLLRGRSALAMPVQAADRYLRSALGEDRIDAVRMLSADRTEDDQWTVRFVRPGGTATVTVRAGLSTPLSRLTCAATRSQRVPVYDEVCVTLT